MIGHLISHWWFWSAYGALLLPIWRYLAGLYAYGICAEEFDEMHIVSNYDKWVEDGYGRHYPAQKAELKPGGYRKGDPRWDSAIGMSLMTVLLWPLVLAGIAIHYCLNHWPSLLKSGPERHYVEAQEKERMANKIKLLESELEIGP